MSKLTRDHILTLARLSRLQLTEEEIELYKTELATILNYVERLDSVDTTGLEPSYQVTGLKNVTRSDEVQTYVARPDALLKLAPQSQAGYIKVGRMI